MSGKFEFERGAQDSDFERRWLAKLSGCLDEAVGEDVRKRVMEGSDGSTGVHGRINYDGNDYRRNHIIARSAASIHDSDTSFTLIVVVH